VKRVDVAGKTIVPGLWDMHAHFEQVEWGPVYPGGPA
jgi:cytosine/adenosine deaminase-related metal-dependent hydrolase